MGMVVRTNSMAMNANNALNKNNSSVSKSLEKLSSGFKINRAADDASGLAISEKMKAQIKALDTASANAADGQSLIQTAEGYMGEVHDMLNRMVELAEKSANGTYETVEGGVATEDYGNAATDRQALQDEMDNLSSEIDRIADTANFNNLKLMNGNLETKITLDDFTTAKGSGNLYTYQAKTKELASGSAMTSGTTYYKADGTSFTATNSGNASADLWTADPTKKENQELKEYTYSADTVNSQKFYDSADETKAKAVNVKASEGGLKLQIGETSKDSDKLTVAVKSFYTEDLFADVAQSTENTSASAITTLMAGETDKTATTINISNQDSASKAAESIRTVINDVSSQRAQLGAMQNRLDYTQNNLDTASENISSANSRIRDTDMAKEMMSFTQGNVLTQAAQAMLAQANQQPSNVLQLLQ